MHTVHLNRNKIACLKGLLTDPFKQVRKQSLKTMKISTFTFRGKDIEMTYSKKNLAYTFEHDGNHYGYKIQLTGRSVMDVASATFLLLQNAIESMDALGIKNENPA